MPLPVLHAGGGGVIKLLPMKNMKTARFLIASACLLFAAGCVVPIKQTKPFIADECKWSAVKGPYSISGSAFLKTEGGDVKLGAGNVVELIPATPYTIERFNKPAFRTIEPRHPGLQQFIRTTVADARGDFEFKDIPPGFYYVACMIQWQVGSFPTGAQALAYVWVKDKDLTRVVVTR